MGKWNLCPAEMLMGDYMKCQGGQCRYILYIMVDECICYDISCKSCDGG